MITSDGPPPATGPALRFGCTICGRCCHGLRLPLSIAEAAAWLERGGDVELLCDAAPALPHSPGSPEAYRAERAVPAMSGDLRVTVALTLTAVFDGACPNRLPDMACAIYADRPDVCRIYPAEVRPERTIDPVAKLCPPEAWNASEAPLTDAQGLLVEPVTAKAIASTRRNGVADVSAKARLMRHLGIDAAALANEAYVIWKPDRANLLTALHDTADAQSDNMIEIAIVSGRSETRAMIQEAGAKDGDADDPRFSYLPLYG